MLEHSIFIDFLLFTVAVAVTVVIVNMRIRGEDDKLLRAKTVFLQSMIDSMPNPIFYKDREGVYLGCNEAFSDMLALKKEAILGKTVYDLAPLELAVVYEKADNELFESGAGQRYESQVRYADGTFHDVVFNKAAFYDGDGDVAGLFGIMFDITDRKKTEEALRRANDELEQRVEERTAELVQSEQESLAKSDFLDSVINSISHGLVVIDVNDYTVKLANKAVVSESTDKAYCYELMHDKTMPCGDIEGHCPLLKVKKTGKPAVAQHDHVNPDGSVSYVEIHAYPVFDENGELIQVIENIMDITDRKKAEQAVIEAKEMAETTSRLMSEFLDMVSHELRTPMTSVHGFAKLIDKSVRKHFKSVIKDDEALGKHVDRIKGNLGIIMSESERLTELISDHLDLSKLESGRVDWRDEEIAPGGLIERAKAASLSLFQNEAVELVIAVEDDLPSFRGDPDRLLQVLINLISNAAKFTEKGSVTCGVQLRDNELLFSVADTGLGIPESQQKIIFSKFSQVQTQKSGKPSGTGLGLPISREIVTHHNGIIWVESEFGNGSTFYFTLPLA